MNDRYVHSKSAHALPMVVILGIVGISGELRAQACSVSPTGNIFSATLCTEGQSASVSSNQIQDILNTVDEKRLRELFPAYQPRVSAGEFHLDVRGLPVNAAYVYNSTQLLFNVPNLGIAESFTGATRDASRDQLDEYLRLNGDAILRGLLRGSAVDPVAGNPASAQSQMVSGDFDAGFDPIYDSSPPGSAFAMGLRFGSYGFDRYTQNVYTLPLAYTYTFTNHDVLAVRLPLTYIEIEGATAYRGQLGLSYKKVLTSRWALTPAVGYGVVDSSDLGSLAQLLSGSLTSDLEIYNNGKFSLSMGNLIGYYVTMPTRVGDQRVDYNLHNTITRDGLLLSVPLQKNYWGREFSVDFYVIGTWFFGDALYSSAYQEVGFSIGPRRSADKREPNLSSHPFGIGLKYLFGQGDIDGLELTFGYRF